MITKKISLNTRDIRSLIKKLNTLQNDINDLPEKITKRVADEGLDTLNTYYASRTFNVNSTDITTSISETQNGYKIIARGKDVIYTEFGTGDEGEQNPFPSPDRNKYNLKDYNSGKYIRKVNPNNKNVKEMGITSGKYWTFVKNGVLHYTQGMPAGLQMFNTAKDLRETIIPKIVKEEIGDVLSKL